MTMLLSINGGCPYLFFTYSANDTEGDRHSGPSLRTCAVGVYHDASKSSLFNDFTRLKIERNATTPAENEG